MKNDYSARPDKITEPWCTWQGFMTAIPSLVFVVTGWKSNGMANACLQSWAAFAGGGKDEFVCILGAVSKDGHMYQSLKETGVCVLNFPSLDIYDRCIKTIGNNAFETDEIAAAGLTAERAAKVDAPRIRECFLNIECEYMWERALFEHTSCYGYQEAAIALRLSISAWTAITLTKASWADMAKPAICTRLTSLQTRKRARKRKSSRVR